MAARTWPEAGDMLIQDTGESLIKGLLFKGGPMKEGQHSGSSSSGALPTPGLQGPEGRSYPNLEAKMVVWGVPSGRGGDLGRRRLENGHPSNPQSRARAAQAQTHPEDRVLMCPRGEGGAGGGAQSR